MYSEDDIHYALDQTRVIHEPDRRIDTFGNTQFRFQLISELMDSVGVTRIRDGRIEAVRPRIITPQQMQDLSLDGFGENGEQFADWLRNQQGFAGLLQYGFQFKRSDLTEELIHQPADEVRDRLVGEVVSSGDPMTAVLEAVDETWEISLLKFTIEMIQKSQGINLFDFKRRGLL
ncbi:MAG: hypothetical protein AAF555_03175 [Verrucomicrobiota bacterium]